MMVYGNVNFRSGGELSCEDGNLTELQATTNLEEVEDQLESPE